MKEENICNHEVTFSIDGGLNDILKVHFIEASPGTIVYFAVGTDFNTAKGEIMEEPRDAILRISFPNKLFLSVEHPETEPSPFAFQFFYQDKSIDDQNAIFLSGYNLEQITIGKEEANLLGVYILAPICAVLILIILVYICRRLNNQRQILQEIEKNRTKGIKRSWTH